MAEALAGKQIAFLTANEGVEQVELTRPWEAVKGAGGRPVLAAPKSGEVQAYHHLERGDTFHVDLKTEELDIDAFDGIVLPGGVANPDQLRLDSPAVQFLRWFVGTGKPVAVICHGPWSLVEADVVRGRTLTSWPSLQTDIRNAGGTWVDEAVVECASGPNTLISSRKPDDLDAFCATVVRVFSGVEAARVG
jgi:protease I